MAVRETLEQRAARWYSGRNQDPQLKEQMAEFAAKFTRGMLEEARPYIQHKPECVWHHLGDPACDCGLKKLEDSWR